MGVIRKSLSFATVGAVRSSSRKQRIAAATLAAELRQAAALEEIANPSAFTAVELQNAKHAIFQREGSWKAMTASPARLREEAARLRDVDPGASSGG